MIECVGLCRCMNVYVYECVCSRVSHSLPRHRADDDVEGLDLLDYLSGVGKVGPVDSVDDFGVGAL